MSSKDWDVVAGDVDGEQLELPEELLPMPKGMRITAVGEMTVTTADDET